MSAQFRTAQPSVRNNASGFFGVIVKVLDLADGVCALATTKVTTIKG